MRFGFLRGALAGAAGTTALNAATYVDMAVRGRGTSSAPQDLIEAVADKANVDIPGSGDERDNRIAGLGPLAGTGVGVAVGAVAGVLHHALHKIGKPLPAPIAVVGLSAAAMALSDVPLTLLGISDPKEWGAKDWAADAVPHLAYSVITYAALTALEGRVTDVLRSATDDITRDLTRSVLLGTATGGRTMTGIALLAANASAADLDPLNRNLARTPVRVALGLAAVGELVGDKLPQAPSRVSAPGLSGRLLFGAMCGAVVASRRTGPVVVGEVDDDVTTESRLRVALCAGVGAVSAAAGAWLGHRWRSLAVPRARFGRRRGRKRMFAAAMAEDAAVIALAAVGARR